MSKVVLAPHFDDAVFSCFSQLLLPGTIVITIFAGIPEAGTSTLWDRICGEADSVAMVNRRIKENDQVLKKLDVSCFNLAYLDRQYDSKPRNIANIAKSVKKLAGANPEYYAPLAGSPIRRHLDHITVRNVGIYLAAEGNRVSFYADIPYMWISAHPSESYLARLTSKAVKLLGNRYLVKYVELSDKDLTLKREAMLSYATQYKMTNLISLNGLSRQANNGHEIELSKAII